MFILPCNWTFFLLDSFSLVCRPFSNFWHGGSNRLQLECGVLWEKVNGSFHIILDIFTSFRHCYKFKALWAWENPENIFISNHQFTKRECAKKATRHCKNFNFHRGHWTTFLYFWEQSWWVSLILDAHSYLLLLSIINVNFAFNWFTKSVQSSL